MRARQEASRRQTVGDALSPGESVLDHSIARMERSPAVDRLRLEGFIIATDRQLVFATSAEFVRSIPYADVASVPARWRLLTRTLVLHTVDGEYRFNVGKTFARSLRSIIRSRI